MTSQREILYKNRRSRKLARSRSDGCGKDELGITIRFRGRALRVAGAVVAIFGTIVAAIVHFYL